MTLKAKELELNNIDKAIEDIEEDLLFVHTDTSRDILNRELNVYKHIRGQMQSAYDKAKFLNG